MRRITHATCAAVILWSSLTALTAPGQEMHNPERTCFQTGSGWQPVIDMRSDVAIVYGVNKSFPDRVESWRKRGYVVHLMTGVAWGGYRDYLDGAFDGKDHWDEAQVSRDGKRIMHGGGVPYMVPTESYTEYLKSLIQIAIDEGVTSVHLEEPEFWNRGGYSEGFKREWQLYYDEPWQPQHSSPEATYRSAKLKYHLYYRALKELFAFTRSYGASKGRNIRCYVPTHSMINYSSWGIVSPESSLATIDEMDGYIAQVWTGTARTPNEYRGKVKERTFETAFLEYGQMVSMTLAGRRSGKSENERRVYFLTDPIEDNPNYTWENYKENYEKTFVAQLMWPQTHYYEVMPWPGRIFRGKYETEAGGSQGIPSWYATELLVLIEALNHMNQEEIVWDSGPRGVGVLVSDTLMFQRFLAHGEEWEDPHHSNLFGLALPLLKHGVPVQPVQMERIRHKQDLTGMAVLLLTYCNMKPMDPIVHEAVADWVKDGGCLAFYGSDRDPYQSIREWWNQDHDYAAPSEHLFELLGLPRRPDEGLHKVGQGAISISRRDPQKLTVDMYGARNVRRAVRRLMEEKGIGGLWQYQNYFHLRRGPYRIIAVLDESQSSDPHVVEGTLIDLFDPTLPVLRHKSIQPGSVGLLYDLAKAPAERPLIVAAACGVDDVQRQKRQFSFQAKGPSATRALVRILMKGEPSKVDVRYPADSELAAFESEWDQGSSTLLVDFRNHPDGVRITIDGE